LFAAGLAGGSTGCLSFLNPPEAPMAEVVQPCQELPACCRSHVYIFLIHGLDPLDTANLSGVRDYCHRLGFNQTYYGQLYHVCSFKKEMRRIHEEDPDARFVLIGFSFGANMACSLAQGVKAEGITIDLLVYLGGNTLENTDADRPENAARIINILATGWIWHGAEIDGAENIQESDIWHFGSPTHARTLDTLTQELTRIACSVPIREPAVLNRSTEPPEQMPTPRPVQLPTAAKPDEWDFLKPTSQLDLPSLRGGEGNPSPVPPSREAPEARPNLLTRR
jgi:hypothetical protein